MNQRKLKNSGRPNRRPSLFLILSLLPLISCWVLAQLPSFFDPDPGSGTCSISAGPGGCSDGLCVPPAWEEVAVETNKSKYLYDEFIVSTPPKKYRHYEERMDYDYDSTDYQDYVGHTWFETAHYVVEYKNVTVGFKLQVSDALAPDGTETNQYSGTYSNYWSTEVFGDWTLPGVYDTNTMEYDTNIYYSFSSGSEVFTITNGTSGAWNAASDPFAGFGVAVPPGTQSLTSTHDNRTGSDPVDDVSEGEDSYGDPFYFHWVVSSTSTHNKEVSDEYTTPMLFTNTVAALPSAYPTNWGPGDFHAYVRTTDADELSAEARKFKFRVVFDSRTNFNYKITWTVSGGPNAGSKTKTVAGTGGTIIEELGEYIPSAQYPDITASPGGVVSVPKSNPGSGGPQAASLGLRMGLGSAGATKGAGELMVHQERPSPAIATPAMLGFLGVTNDVEIITDGSNWVRQAKAPQTLADVVTLTTNAYEVRFYTATNSGSLSNGLYVPTGSPFVVWGVTGSTNTNFFRITETRGASVITNDFEWAETNQSWTLTSGNGLRREARSEVWSSTNTVRTITHSVLRPSDNALIAKSVEVSQQFPFGLHPTSTSIGDGAATRTTTYAYYTDAANDGDNYGKLKTTVHPDGSWQWHEYNSAKRLAKTFSAFGNQSPTNSAALCRVTEFSYTPVGTGDDGTVQGWMPRTTVEKLLGTEIGRSYAVFKTNETSQIRCQTASAAWDASDNLVTTTTTYSSADFKGWTKSERRPDGTLSLYEYSVDGSGNLSTLVWTGQPNGGGTAIVAGTKLVTLQGPLGNVIERTTVDIAADLITGSETFSDFDEFGRPGRVTYLDSTFKLYSYLCCGLESETDRDGVTTTYGYDALKRRITTTRNSIAHIQTLDAANRVLFTQRQGTNASTITLASMVYDTAGRLLYQTNAVGNVTAYSETQDPRTETQTLPNGATRIQTYFRDGSLQSVTGTAVHGVRYDYGVESDLPYVKEIKLLTNGTDSAEWTKIFTDIAGRSFKTVYPDDAYTQSYYNNAGQLWKQRDADGVVTLYAYNGEGQQEYTALDMDRDDTINFDGTDRITRTVRDVAAAHSTNVRRTRSYVWTTNSSTNSLLTSTVEAAVDGTRTWQTAFGLTSQHVSLCGGTCAATNIAPDGSYTTSVKTNGYLMVVTRYDSQGIQLSATTYTYDEYGRQKTITDARNGTTTLIYDDADRVTSVTTPSPGSGQSPLTTTTYFDDVGQAWRVVKPDGTSVTNEFTLRGERRKVYGSREYPVEYTFDYAGRMKTMKTWQNFATDGGAAVTTWNYSTNRGFMVSKQHQDGNGPAYTYSAAGRPTFRTWARGIVSTNSYDAAGSPTNTAYSDGITPAVATVYDRRGRAVISGDVERTFNDAGQLVTENYTAGPLSGFGVTNSYDAYLRRTNLAGVVSTAYAYDYSSRLASVTDGTNSASYAYLTNSPLIQSLTFKQSSTTRLTTTKAYDYANRLTGMSSAPSADSAVDFTYQYNDASQRTRVDLADGSYWIYQYDSLGQVKSGKRYWADGTVVAGQQFEYGFDDIGNRKTAVSGGSQFGTSLRTNTYAANLLNQYTNRTVLGYAEAQGSANSNATVTVNNESTYRKGAYYRKELSVANSSAAVWQGVTNIAVLNYGGTNGEDIVTTKTGNVLVPKTPELFSYDADGNTVQDGRWNYSWDGENRLTRLEGLTNAPDASRQRLDFAYDHQFRRVQKVLSAWSGSAYVAQSTNRYLYDGWNLVAILDSQSTLLCSFRWGTDLSGSLQGAGGVGGLLSMTVHQGTNAGTYFYCYDGNGNVAALVSAANGTVVARYEYGPFGELLRATGSLSLLNPFRFSTKFCDDESGIYYYGYRYYDSSTGRWLNRDPKQERGGLNIVAFLKNSAISTIDYLGLQAVLPPSGPPPCCPSPCDIMKAAIETALEIMRSRYWDMLVDFNNLFNNQPTGSMSWQGHQQQYEGWRNRLNNLLQDFYEFGCHDQLPPDSGALAMAPAPNAPWSVQNPGLYGPPAMPPGIQLPSTAIPGAGQNSGGNSGTGQTGLSDGQKVGAAIAAVGAGYAVYRCVRMIPSLFPALWWTAPANAAAP